MIGLRIDSENNNRQILENILPESDFTNIALFCWLLSLDLFYTAPSGGYRFVCPRGACLHPYILLRKILKVYARHTIWVSREASLVLHRDEIFWQVKKRIEPLAGPC